MSLAGAIYAQLASDAGVQAIAGNPARVYQSSSPEGVFPLATIDAEEDADEAIEPHASQRFSVTVESAALSRACADALAAAVKASLNRQTWTHNGIVITSSLFIDSSSSSYSDSGNADRIYYLVEQHFSVLAAGT